MTEKTILTDKELAGVAGGTGTDLYFFYTIAKGDTLDRIARRYNTTEDELVRINRIADPNLIKAGDRIKVPRS